MSETNLFDQLSGLTRKTTRILFAPGERIFDEQTGQSYSIPQPGVVPIVFEVHAITPNEVMMADAVITALPPQMFEEHAKTGTVGMVKVMTGYDYDCPAYAAARQKQVPLRDAHIAIMGCPALRETTPGKEQGIAAQAAKLLECLPAAVLEFLAVNIEKISIYNVIGNEEVTSFLAAGSTAKDTRGSKGSGGRSPRQRKKQPVKKATRKTSTTSSTPPPKRGA
jgi:hypothetical protein